MTHHLRCKCLTAGLLVLASFLPAGCGTSAGGGSATTTTGTGGSGGGSASVVVTPVVSSVTPATVQAGGTDPILLTVRGSGYVATSQVSVNGVSVTTTFVSSSELSASVLPSLIAAGGQLSIAVSNGTLVSAQGSTSTVTSTFPLPTVAASSPASVLAGSAGISIDLTGTGFVPSTTAKVNGTARAVTYKGPTAITLTLRDSDLQSAGTLSVSLVNGVPGGGTSVPLALTVVAPVPVLTGVTPADVPLQTASNLSLTGSGFQASSTVLWNGSPHPVAFVSATSLMLALSATDTAAAGSGTLVVRTPAPGGGDSNAIAISVRNPSPSRLSLAPSSVMAGSGAQTVFLSGSGLLASSTVSVNGNVRTAALQPDGTMALRLSATDLAATGAITITVSNPPPGGGTSAPLSLGILNPAPTVTATQPAAIEAGSTGVTLSLSGSGFLPNSTAQVNGVDRSTAYVNATSLQVKLLDSDVATPGALSIVITNPAPGGGPSSPATVRVSAAPQPVLTSLSPAPAAVGAAFTLHVFGSGFRSSSTISWSGAPVPTLYVSGNELTATVPAGLVAAPGTASIAVTTPPPGGGQSATLTLAIVTPTPRLVSLSPSVIFRASPSTTLTLNGSGFLPTSIVQFNGAPQATTYVSNTSLSFTVASAALPSSTTASVMVTNPSGSGDASSAAVSVEITSQVKPVITKVTLSVSGQGTLCPAVSAVVTGTAFGYNSLVFVNGVRATSTTTGFNTLYVTLPSIITGPQASFTVQLPSGADYLSDPYVLPASVAPAGALCVSPNAPIVYSGLSFSLKLTPTVINSAAPPTITSVTLPSGITALSPGPYPAQIGTRVSFGVDGSMPAGTYTVVLNEMLNGTASTVSLPVTVRSTPPVTSLSTSLQNEIAVPVGGSNSLTLSALANYDSSGTPDYLITLGTSGLPDGVSATFVPAQILPGDLAVMTLTAASTAPVRQNVPVNITGTVMPSAQPASVGISVNVQPVPGTIPNNRSVLTPLGATPASVVFDDVHNLVFAADPVWNRVDVIANDTRQLVRSIPVRSANNLSLSVDKGTVWVATGGQRIYAIDTATLALRTFMLPNVQFPGDSTTQRWTGERLFAMADGTLLVSISQYTGSGSYASFVWNPETGSLKTLPGFGVLYTRRSGDGRFAYSYATSSSSCSLLVYSAATQATSSTNLNGYGCSLLAVNQDGSRLVVQNAGNNPGYALLDRSLATIGTIPGYGTRDYYYQANIADSNLTGGFVFSPDSSRLYAVGKSSAGMPGVLTFDVATQKLLGIAPALTSSTPPLTSGYGGLTAAMAVDRDGIVIGVQTFGVAFEDSTYFQDFGLSSHSEAGVTSFQPQSGPLSGGTKYFISGLTTLMPDVWFGGQRASVTLASSGSSYSSLAIETPPSSIAGPVDVKFIYPNGVQAYAANAFSYGPAPSYAVYSGSAPDGGAPGEITGYGLPLDSATGSVSVGGAAATITSVQGQYPPWTGESVQSTYLKFTLPPGTPGYRDVQVQTPSGSGSLPRAVFYARSVRNYSLGAAASAVTYDRNRKQAYVAAGSQVLVYSVSGGQMGTPLPVPALRGMYDLRNATLSADGTYLLVANFTDGSLAVIDLDHPGNSYAIDLSGLVSGSGSVGIGPGTLAALAGNRVLVIPQATSAYSVHQKYAIVDLASHTAAILNDVSCLSQFSDAYTQPLAGGTKALIVTSGNTTSACLYDSAKAYLSSIDYLWGFRNVTGSLDGSILASDMRLYDGNIAAVGAIAQPVPLYGTALAPSYPTSPATATLRGGRMNDAGSLYFVPHSRYFEVIDVATASLRVRFSLNETIQDVVQPIAVDESGKLIFLLTDQGLTVVDMGDAPLSIGEVLPTLLAAGSTVTVLGSGFTPGLTATLDGTALSVGAVDDSSFTFTVPSSGTGAHDLTLSRPDGSTYTLKGALRLP